MEIIFSFPQGLHVFFFKAKFHPPSLQPLGDQLPLLEDIPDIRQKKCDHGERESPDDAQLVTQGPWLCRNRRLAPRFLVVGSQKSLFSTLSHWSSPGLEIVRIGRLFIGPTGGWHRQPHPRDEGFPEKRRVIDDVDASSWLENRGFGEGGVGDEGGAFIPTKSNDDSLVFPPQLGLPATRFHLQNGAADAAAGGR